MTKLYKNTAKGPSKNKSEKVLFQQYFDYIYLSRTIVSCHPIAVHRFTKPKYGGKEFFERKVDRNNYLYRYTKNGRLIETTLENFKGLILKHLNYLITHKKYKKTCNNSVNVYMNDTQSLNSVQDIISYFKQTPIYNNIIFIHNALFGIHMSDTQISKMVGLTTDIKRNKTVCRGFLRKEITIRDSNDYDLLATNFKRFIELKDELKNYQANKAKRIKEKEIEDMLHLDVPNESDSIEVLEEYKKIFNEGVFKRHFNYQNFREIKNFLKIFKICDNEETRSIKSLDILIDILSGDGFCENTKSKKKSLTRLRKKDDLNETWVRWRFKVIETVPNYY